MSFQLKYLLILQSVNQANQGIAVSGVVLLGPDTLRNEPEQVIHRVDGKIDRVGGKADRVDGGVGPCPSGVQRSP